MKERLIIIFVAIIAGLLITGVGFLIYQSTIKVNDTPQNAGANAAITPTDNESGLYVRLTEPQDETLTNKRTITITGTTNPGNIIVVSTNLEDVQAEPSSEGNFSLTVDIDAGANKIVTRAISPDGSSVEDIRTITFSTEEF